MRDFGHDQQPKTDEKLNEEKIKRFYKEVIQSYQDNIKNLYWGEIDDFVSLIDTSEKGEDNVIVACKNSENIKLSRKMFDFLFRGDDLHTFDFPVGQSCEYGDHVFIELVKSPAVTINREIEERGIFPVTKDINGSVESCFFIKSEKYEENYYDYPQEIIPFFVLQMKTRLKTFEDRLPTFFIDHFEPMKYVLKIKKGQENLLIKLLYKLGTNLGIVENIMKNGELSIKIEQEIKSKLDGEGNINLTNEQDESLNSLKFYISAIRNPNPYYRFLDAYHIFESLFYKHFYNYVKNLNSNIEKGKLYDEIKNHLNESQLLKLVLQDYLSNGASIRELKDKFIKMNAEDLAEAIDKNYNIKEWSEDNTGEFASKLSDFIYNFRNAIVHSKESNRHIEKIEEFQGLTSNFVHLTDIVLELAKRVLEKNIERW